MPSHSAIFFKLLETGSLTRTAEALGCSQSAVSQGLKAMERELGVTLLGRGRGGLYLTVDGRDYLPYLKALHCAETELGKKRAEILRMKDAAIRIGTFTGVSRTLLPLLMEGFKREYPGVRFFLRQGDYTDIARWVRDGVVDFGFVNEQFETGLSVRLLYTERMMALVPLQHPLAGRSSLSLRDLAAHPFILLAEGERSVPLAAFQRLGLNPRIDYKVHDDYTILAMVRRNLGVSVLYSLVLPGFAEGVRVMPLEETLQRTVAVAVRDYATMPHAARAFLRFILEKTGEAIARLDPPEGSVSGIAACSWDESRDAPGMGLS